MMNEQSAPTTGTVVKHRRGGLILLGLLPVVLLVWLAGYYTHNNCLVSFPIPAREMPEDNACAYFLSAEHLARHMKHPNPGNTSAQVYSFANLAASVPEAKQILAKVRRGLDRPYLSPQPTTFVEVIRALIELAAYDEVLGHYRQAADIHLDAIEMAIMLQHGGGLSDEFHSLRYELMGMEGFEALLPRLSAPELAHVAARLDRIAAKRVNYADIVREQEYIDLGMDVQLLNDPNSLHNPWNVRSLMEDPETPEKPLTWKQDWAVARFALTNKQAIVRENQAYFEAMIREVYKPYTPKPTVAIPDNPLAQLRGDILEQARSKFVAMDVVLEIFRTEVALFRYKAVHGAFPDTLATLVPGYLETIPIDPFGGGGDPPLHYSAQGSGRSFLLYSLGVDMQDNGGQPAQHIASTPGDIVGGHLPRRTFRLPSPPHAP